MTPRDVFRACREGGIVLTLTDGRVRFKAPTGALSPELRTGLQAHKATLGEVLWRLEGMRTWAPGGAVPVPLAKPGQVGGPGHCHSCGVEFEDAEQYGRCESCWLAFAVLMDERRGEGAPGEIF